MAKSFRVNSAHLERRSDRAASGFEAAGFVHAATLGGLLERLEPMRVEARSVVDLGCRTGAASRALERRFRGARVIAVERSQCMLQKALGGRRWFSRVSYLRADLHALPLADQSVDVVVSNLALAALDDPVAVAREVARVLRKDGLFAFVTLGPDSLGILRRAWERIDPDPHVQRFIDMHDLGDLFVGAGLLNPVLDVDRLGLDYASSSALFRDLTATAARNTLAGRRRTLTGTSRFRRMRTELEASSGGGAIRVDLELVYGHCWGSGRTRPDGDVHIAPDAIPVRRR